MPVLRCTGHTAHRVPAGAEGGTNGILPADPTGHEVLDLGQLLLQLPCPAQYSRGIQVSRAGQEGRREGVSFTVLRGWAAGEPGGVEPQTAVAGREGSAHGTFVVRVQVQVCNSLSEGDAALGGRGEGGCPQ